MATNKRFSFAAFVSYGNGAINNTSGHTAGIQNAFRADLKNAIKRAGYPTKDEIGIIDSINDFDMSNTLSKVPELVSGFMHDEQRSFDIPVADDKTCPATIKVVEVGEKTKEGPIMLGDKKGQTYKSTIKAHEEVSVKNRRDKFKK